MLGAAGIECSPANGAGIIASQISPDTERTTAVAAVDGFFVEVGLGPNCCRVVSSLVVALNASVKGIAALVFDGNNIALGVVMSALGSGVGLGAVNYLSH